MWLVGFGDGRVDSDSGSPSRERERILDEPKPILALTLIFSLAIVSMSAGPANAASYYLQYDDAADGVIGTGSIIGTGTFSYDGPATAGSFALSSLTGMTFDATILGASFSTADILSDLSTTGISVFSLGGGEFGLVFTGNGGQPGGGSLDLRNGFQFEDNLLTHEPTSAINDPIGCCGGNGTINLYALNPQPGATGPESFGDYSASTIPEPGTAALLAVGLLSFAATRRNESIARFVQ